LPNKQQPFYDQAPAFICRGFFLGFLRWKRGRFKVPASGWVLLRQSSMTQRHFGVKQIALLINPSKKCIFTVLRKNWG
jgi:hypothetical protein